MTATSHISRICPKCGGQLQIDVEICPWCHAPVHANGNPQRIRIRKKRSVLETYIEHIRRHWVYFVLAIIAALVAALLLIYYAQRPSRPLPAPAFTLMRF
ncbi:MAG: hypothetical protein M1453_14115 [Acidobacteria bacterium]|nr:hypothetical protein [Acidobacteriota bacterium]